MPDFGFGKLTPAMIAELSIAEYEEKNKIFDFKQNNAIRFARLGAYSPNSNTSTAKDVWGVLVGMVSVGVPSTKGLGIPGAYHRWGTYGIVANDVAGVLKLDGWTAHRLFNPVIRFGIRMGTNTAFNRRMFAGWGPQRMLTANTDTDPISGTESGVFFGHGAGDSQFYIFHNDGVGACVKTPTGINIPGTVTNYIVEIVAKDSPASFTITLYSITSTGQRGSVVGSPVVLTSEIPASQTGLYMQNLVMGSTIAQQWCEPYYIEVY